MPLIPTKSHLTIYRRCIDLSQGLDRETDTRAYGIVGCITPCGIPYITTRGGPLCGLEALSLQGLPLDRLLLTRERHRELQDLAGNAMSSTVVGAAVLSALIVGYKVLGAGRRSSGARNTMPKHRSKGIIPREDYPLSPSGVSLGHVFDVNIPELQVQAARSARYCMCERQTATRQNILRCTLCHHTVCSDCDGNPTHAYERWSSLVRSQPLDFVSSLKSILPTRLVLSGISREDYHVFNTDVIKASTLGHDGVDKSAMYGGSKLDKMIEIIRWTIPQDERVLLFIQFPELMQVASKALELAQIKHTVISPTDRRSAQKVEQFQKTSFGDNRVLVLNLGGEMAAGL